MFARLMKNDHHNVSPQQLAGNIPKLYAVQFTHWFLLPMAIIVPFYKSNGLDTTEIMLIQAFYSIVMVGLEIPSGYIGDIIGRKQSVLWGMAMFVLGYGIYTLAGSFWGFALGSLVLAAGSSFISGSDSALLYDTLNVLKDKAKYVKAEGRMYAVSNFAEAGAAIAGSTLAVYHIRYPYIAQVFICLTGVLIAYTLIEPPLEKRFDKKDSWGNIKKALSFILRENKKLRLLIIYSGIAGATTLTIAWFTQPFFEYIKIPLLYFGFLWTGINLSVGLASWSAHKLQHRITPLHLALLISTLLVCAYAGIAFLGNIFALLFIFMSAVGRGFASPIFKNWIHAETPSYMRATVLSIRSFVIRISFASLSPLLGYLTDIYSIRQAMFLGFLIFSFGLLLSVFFLKKGRVLDRF